MSPLRIIVDFILDFIIIDYIILLYYFYLIIWNLPQRTV